MTDTIQMTQNGDMLKRQKNATVMCEAVLKTKVAVTLTRQEKLSMPSSTWEAVRKGDVLKNGFVFPLLKEGPQRDIYHIFQFQYLQTL